jgi:nucleotide-binding universal stress UspA family protein
MSTAETALASGEATGARPLVKDVLVPLDRSAGSTNALDYARALAAAGGGKATALMISVLAFHPVTMYGEASVEVWLAARAQAEKEADALEKALRTDIGRIAPEAEFRRSDVEGGDAPARFAEIGRYFDLSVVGFDKGGGSDLQRRTFNAALFYSGRPVIVVPEAAEVRGAPQRIVVAWSPTREAARAVHDALPLLRAAAEVRIVVVDDERTKTESDQPGADIALHLARHRVKADVRHVPAGPNGVTATLLDEARYAGAELVVLGGYGHSRFSEWMLGGVSRDILEKSKLPLLFSH